ncbi:MAG TPA: N-acetylmuramoyl-L-alanine amidase [Gemmatimonadales bacterium]
MVQGPLDVRIAYPRAGVRVWEADQSRWYIPADSGVRIERTDSAFVFGSVGRGDAQLQVNGREVAVYPTGGWIAWLPLPADTIARFDLVATAAADTLRATFAVPVARTFVPPARVAWIDTTSFSPTGSMWVMPDEEVRLSVRAAPDAEIRLVTLRGTSLGFRRDRRLTAAPWGEIAFGTVARDASGETRTDRYTAAWRGALGPTPGLPFTWTAAPDPADSAWAWLEAISGADTARARWPLRIGTLDPANLPVVRVDDDTAGTGRTDSSLAGRPVPYGVYHWFFPTGTVATVSGRSNDQVRLRLSRASVAWVDAVDVHPVADALEPRGVAGSLRLRAESGYVSLRVPLPARVPFAVEEFERELRLRLYGVAGDMDWIQYGPSDPLVKLISFSQPAEDETVLTLQLAQPVWGYRTEWIGTDLHWVIRRPPEITPRRPLAGRRIALDAGHPPGGSTGPTGVREPDVTLAVARKARTLLEQAGATVIMLRDTAAPLGLPERTVAAERSDAELLVSIHANAVPDGVNPFVNNGTSVYYYHPRAAPLARAINRALVRRLGFRDLGIGRGDLALARPTWMPAVLVEGLFMMLPDQEAVLASEDGQWRYARGVVEGVEEFLRGGAER